MERKNPNVIKSGNLFPLIKCIIVNLDFFEDLLALSSPKYLKSIKQAREDYQKGRLYSHKEVFGTL